MKRDIKKALYESIMTAVAKEVKKALNENISSPHDLYDYIDNADLFHCPKFNILDGSWVEEQYAEENGIDYDNIEYNKDFEEYCKNLFVDNLPEGITSFKLDDDGFIYCERGLYIKNYNGKNGFEIGTKIIDKPLGKYCIDNPLGKYWSFEEENANAINSQNRENIILRAVVHPDNVDWAETIISNLIDPDETELTLKPGETIVLKQIKDSDGNIILNDDVECRI